MFSSRHVTAALAATVVLVPVTALPADASAVPARIRITRSWGSLGDRYEVSRTRSSARVYVVTVAIRTAPRTGPAATIWPNGVPGPTS